MKIDTSLTFAVLLIFAPAAHAQFTYSTTNGTITITGYTGTDSAVAIPSTIDGLPVTSIGSKAFSAMGEITDVTIPNSVTSISYAAFNGCTGLTDVAIPNSVTNIGDYAFDGCSSLTNIMVDPLNPAYSSVEGVLFNRSRMTLMQYPSRKNGVYNIPNGVTSIGVDAFFGSSITGVKIPNSVSSIGYDAFYECFSLTNIVVDPLNPAYSSVSGVLFNQSRTTLIQYPGGKVGFYFIPDGVTNIGDSAFEDCTNLTGVTVPTTVISIRDGAFGECTNLTNITIFNGVTSIGDFAFSGCSSLTTVTIPNSVTNIGDNAFDDCARLTSVTIGSGVTSIGHEAFLGCSSLVNITIGNTITSIPDEAFYSCLSLTNITIGNGVTSIGYAAFGECANLTSVTIPSSVTSIGDSAFVGCSNLNSVTIPNSITNIGSSAFAECVSLTSVTIPNSVTSIGNNTFSSCASLANVIIPNSVTTIGYSAFSFCSSLASVTIPSSVISIGAEAFFACSSLSNAFFLGNAPFAAVIHTVGGPIFVFDGSSTVPVVYYLPGTTGWSTNFGGAPTAFWTLPYPLILNNTPGFGVQTNSFGFTVSWATNLSVVVEASTDFNNSKWSPIITNALTGGIFYFTDPQWANYPSRFYRVRSE
jgi:hypothetical protein